MAGTRSTPKIQFFGSEGAMHNCVSRVDKGDLTVNHIIVDGDLSVFPADDMDLSDAWVVAIVSSKLSREERGLRWPQVFSAKGLLRAQYVHKGQAAKLCDNTAQAFEYALLFGEHNLVQNDNYAAFATCADRVDRSPAIFGSTALAAYCPAVSRRESSCR